MISNARTVSVILRIVSFLLAIYLLNFSIDSRDARPDFVPEDLGYNDIESLYEFVLESVLGVENAVEEHDERDQDDGGSFEFKKFYTTPFVSGDQINAQYLSTLHSPVDYCEPLAIRAAEINFPPPRA